MTTKHTPGPWRWEVSRKNKSVHLCGGVPRFDLTVIDFVRWGTGGASLRLREDAAGLNIMHRPHEREGWVNPIVGREHHADWCATLDHPDARLIAAAPDLLAALTTMMWCVDAGYTVIKNGEVYDAQTQLAVETIRKAIAKAKGEPCTEG